MLPSDYDAIRPRTAPPQAANLRQDEDWDDEEQYGDDYFEDDE